MRFTSRASGFTLVELMVSVAIALVLILGINTIFKITSQAVGAGESTLNCERDARTVMQTMLSDLTSVLSVATRKFTPSVAAPCFVIRSEHVSAFRNGSDQQSATDQSEPYHDDFLFANMNGSHIAPVPLVHWRSHRLDRLGFFSKTNFARQTSSDSYSFVASTKSGQVETSAEAWVNYGHAAQPNKNAILGTSSAAADWPGPGDSGTNDHNFFASDWMLMRMAILLNDTLVKNPTGDYLAYNSGTGNELSPLSATSMSASGKYSIDTARLDVAATSIAYFSIQDPSSNTTRKNGIWQYAWNYTGTNPPSLYGQNWWDQMVGNFRYKAGPYMLPEPGANAAAKITPYGLAKTAPNLIRGCSQFIVEYAGSYYSKNPDGTASTANVDSNGNPIPVPDGQIDFSISNGVRQIRWYGFPRWVSGSVDSNGKPILNPDAGDVVPLRDVYTKLNASWGAYADAERFSTKFPAAGSNYMDPTVMDPSSDQTLSTRYTYAAAWGPDVQQQPFPKMIRIIIGIDDHEGRLNQPLLFEYVYDVQQ